MLKDYLFGRFSILNMHLGNIFIKKVFEGTILGDQRSYSVVVYSILQEVFHIKITPLTLLMVNRVVSVFLLIVVFLIAKKVFKRNLISLLVLVSFISSRFILINFSSIGYTIVAVFFTYLSILFLFKFMKERDLTAFILSNIAVILAAYYKFELSFLFGLPYIAYFCLFLNKNKQTKRCMLITTIVLLLISMSIVEFYTHHNEGLWGERLNEQFKDKPKNLISHLINAVYLLKHNIFVEKDLLLQSGRVSLFTYSGFIISSILVIALVYSLIKRKEIKSKHKWVYIFAFYNMIYFIFNISFTKGLMGRGIRYSVNYYLCEIIVTYFAISWLAGKLISKQSKYIINATKFLFILLFFVIALKVSPQLSLQFTAITSKEVPEMKLLRENVNIDESCKIIKINPNQPYLDYYFGLQKNSVFFGAPPLFYESIKRYKKEGKCFYYYDQYFTEYEYRGEGMHRIDLNKVNQLFISCNKSIEFESPLEDRPFSLVKYIC